MTTGNELATTDNTPAQLQRAAGPNMRALNLNQMRGVAQAMADSGMFPDISKDSAKAFVKILAGQEMGIPPFEAMGGISIIQGKATVGGNIMASRVKASSKYDYKIQRRDNTGCSIEFFEKNGDKMESLGVEEFDEADAKAAQLFSKDMWKKYPKNMFFNRAISNGVRTYCPDVLGGGPVYTPEEMGAQVDDEGNAIIGPGMTYSQDPPAKALPSMATEEAAAPQAAPADAPIIKSLLDVSNLLLERGFDDKSERGRVVLRIGGVQAFEELTNKDVTEVFEQIVEMDDETLSTFADQKPEPQAAPAKPDEVVTELDDEALNNGTLLDHVEDVFPGAKPLDEKPTEPTAEQKAKPSGRQIAKARSLFVKKKIKDDQAQQDFTMGAIGKNFAVTSGDFDKLIEALEK